MRLEWNDLYVSPINKNKNIKTKYVDLLKCSSGSLTRGEMLAIMGPSGGGKTTLMNILAGRCQPGALTQGSIRYNGEFRSASEWFDIVGFVEQEPYFIESLTIYETLHYAYRFAKAKVKKYDKKRLEDSDSQTQILEEAGSDKIGNENFINTSLMNESEFLQKVIEDLNLENVQNNIISKLSGGEKKRTSIGIALVSQVSILFFDEPTSGLDTSTSSNIMIILKKLAVEYHKIIILSIHQPSLNIFKMFNKLILLSKGNVLYQGESEKVETFFIEKGYKNETFMPAPEYVLEICNMNSRNKNMEIVEMENKLLGVKKITKNKQLLKKKNDIYMSLSPSAAHIYYLLRRKLLITSKKKVRFLKLFLFRFIIPFIMILGIRELEKMLEKSTGTQESNMRAEYFFGYIPTLIFIMQIFSSAPFFYDELVTTRKEIMNHYFSSASFYIFMLIYQVFEWMLFISILLIIAAFLLKSYNLSAFIIFLLSPLVVIPFCFFVGSIIPVKALLYLLVSIPSLILLIPNEIIIFLYKQLIGFNLEGYKKYIHYFFYIFIFISPKLLFKKDLKQIEDNEIEDNEIEINDYFTDIMGEDTTSKRLLSLIFIITIGYITLSFLITAYRQRPAIRMKTEKKVK